MNLLHDFEIFFTWALGEEATLGCQMHHVEMHMVVPHQELNGSASIKD